MSVVFVSPPFPVGAVQDLAIVLCPYYPTLCMQTTSDVRDVNLQTNSLIRSFFNSFIY